MWKKCHRCVLVMVICSLYQWLKGFACIICMFDCRLRRPSLNVPSCDKGCFSQLGCFIWPTPAVSAYCLFCCQSLFSLFSLLDTGNQNSSMHQMGQLVTVVPASHYSDLLQPGVGVAFHLKPSFVHNENKTLLSPLYCETENTITSQTRSDIAVN